MCREDGLEIGFCELVLRHVGYEADQRHKIARNVPLLRAYLEREPERVYCWWHLGDMLELAGDKAGAVEAWERGLGLARAQHRIAPDVPNFQPFLSLIVLRQQEGAPVDALVEEIRQLGSEPRGPVSVGFPPSLSILLSVPLLETLYNEQPLIRLHIAEAIRGREMGGGCRPFWPGASLPVDRCPDPPRVPILPA